MEVADTFEDVTCLCCGKVFNRSYGSAGYKKNGYCSWECSLSIIKRSDPLVGFVPRERDPEPTPTTSCPTTSITQWLTTSSSTPTLEVLSKRKQSRKGRTRDCLSITNWAKIRERILVRDGYKCKICHDDGVDAKLNVHHINYNRLNNKPSNLVTVCSRCHHRIHNEKYKPELYEDWPPPWGDLTYLDEPHNQETNPSGS